MTVEQLRNKTSAAQAQEISKCRQKSARKIRNHEKFVVLLCNTSLGKQLMVLLSSSYRNMEENNMTMGTSKENC